jgi:ABC-type Fe3+/spermidine/putrescine transport system ATPase subunit
VAKPEMEDRVCQALEMVKMGEYSRSSPAKLSGGQQQRVALARALVNRPQLLLLDEPLSALDANLRRQMQLELKSLQREVGIAFLFVTHDQEEAMALSDRIALLRAGQIEQLAAPREIYDRPTTAYTAAFIGQTNLLRGEVRNGVATSGKLSWPAAGPDGPAVFSLRPECIRVLLTRAQAAKHNGVIRFRAKLLSQTFGGAAEFLEIQTEDGRVLRLRVPSRLTGEGPTEFEFSARDAIRVRDSEAP